MKSLSYALLGAGLSALAGAGALAQAQKAPGGTATYWMTAETSSGMTAMGQGGKAGYVRNLMLQLGTGRRPAGEPSAEHLPPSALNAGPSLPLVSPKSAPGTATGALPAGMERPKGRMLIYWGCGEHARPGQPVVIDFATLTSGKAKNPFGTVAFKTMTPPAAGSSATYGEWPNQRSGTRVPSNGSLVGAHVVRGNYTPDINFTLAAGQDFLAPVKLTSNTASGSGAVPVAWSPVPGAQAWFAAAMGSGANGDFVMWSSSESQVHAMMMDYLPQEEIRRLVGAKVLLPATADRCTVPAEVARAAPQAMLSVTALGAEANFSHPARPAKASASWRPEWTVKLRTKSTHMGMLGMDMAAMMSGRDDADGDGTPAETPQQARKRSKREILKRGIGSLFGQ
jgi:hypothetical protein